MADLASSPFAPAQFPDLPEISGVSLGTAELRLKYSGRPDVLLAVLPPESRVAGVFTRSTTASAAVRWGQTAVKDGRGRAFLVNAGNSIAFTGKAGETFVARLTTALAGKLDCAKTDVFTASTGVIGEPADPAPIEAALDDLLPGGATWEQAARAIMTTDTYAKGAGATAEIDGVKVAVSGIAKGSGMIEPNMATMLSFIFTDAAIAPDVLQRLLSEAAGKSFNSITVDSDSSTSDTVLLAATGKAGNREITDITDPALMGLRDALNTVCLDLAHQIVKDGEGASKFITVRVSGAEDDRAAKVVAKSIANSPLVKTAIAGEDANWGRIVMAVGKAGEYAPENRLTISVGGIALARNGERVDDFDEAPVTAHMKGTDISIEVDLGVAAGHAVVWTCDLTHAYIDINADYRS